MSDDVIVGLGLVRQLPLFSEEDIRNQLRVFYSLEGSLVLLNSERDLCYMLTTTDNNTFIFRVSNEKELEGVIDFQSGALAHIEVQAPLLPVPRIILSSNNKLYEKVTCDLGRKHFVRLFSYLDGEVAQRALTTSANPSKLRFSLGASTARIAKSLRNFFHPCAQENSHLWDLSRVTQLRGLTRYLGDAKLKRNCEAVLDAAEDYTYPALEKCRHQIVHQDAHMGNVLVSPVDDTVVTGVIDFGDMLYGSIVADVAAAADCYLEGDSDPLAVLGAVCAGYDSVFPLEEEEIDLLYDVALLRAVNTILIINARDFLSGDGKDNHIDNSGKHARMLAILLEKGRAVATAYLRRACGFPVSARGSSDLENLKSKRLENLGEIWHFYQEPLHITRGEGAWLISSCGSRYLDAYNNVPQLGHSHQYVVQAIARQASALNTNTRYLCDVVAEYADRLLSSLPSHFDSCIFVNSGSEANDVAANIAEVETGREGAIVMEDAYHGVTQRTMKLSPLTTGKTSAGVETIPAPDYYRDTVLIEQASLEPVGYSCRQAIARLNEQGYRPAFFMVDTALCSNGIPDVPEGYFDTLADAIKESGGMIIVDEVQTGLGRLGELWGSKARGMDLDKVDFITLGKPVANGHPLGVILTNSKIWNRFNSKNELFSTFGGNTVSCSAGLAVLDVIERDDLLVKSITLGEYFREELEKLAQRFPIIGEVRGQGLLIAVELVVCRRKKFPAVSEAKNLVEKMREKKVLVGSSGRYKNILKLRPSLAWGKDEVDFFIGQLSESLAEISGELSK
ncbi:MAG: aminotransferase class III-fold pyridoxal phosphate-dependent enzyme [Cellvibrionaceae bacterium]|nr:aminotransferase class III-fold pyridoxal phosphate-dependent enzyme [Cellvibrionaceae bacterium]